jgi:hypothetical protein
LKLVINDLHLLAQEAAGALRSYENLPEADRDHRLTYKAAGRLVEARALFTDAEGRPDLRGRSFAYRQWLGQVFTDAGLTTVEAKVKAGNRLRFVVNIVLRERYSAEQLAEYGLQAENTRTRAQQRRVQQFEAAALFRPGARFDGDQMSQAAELMSNAVRRMSPGVVKKRERAAVVADLEDTYAQLGELLERLNAKKGTSK